MQKTQCIIDTCTTYDSLVGGIVPITLVSDRGFTTKVTTVPEQGAPNESVGWYSLVAPDGASHILGQISSTEYETVDGTGYHYHYDPNDPTGDVAYDADGSKIGQAG